MNSERKSRAGHPTQAISTVILSPEVVDNGKDRGQLEERVRALTGRMDIHIVDVRPTVGKDGKTLAYEVDIR